jgi:hypothetical protein
MKSRCCCCLNQRGLFPSDRVGYDDHPLSLGDASELCEHTFTFLTFQEVGEEPQGNNMIDGAI